MGSIYTPEGRVGDPIVAEKMALVMKPYYEEPLGLWKRLVSTRLHEILIGVKEAEKAVGLDEERALKMIEAQQEKEEQLERACMLAYASDEFKEFVAKMRYEDFFFSRTVGHETLRGSIDGLPIVAEMTMEKKFKYRSVVDNKPVYDYEPRYSGSIGEVGIRNRAIAFLTRYRELEKQASHYKDYGSLDSYELEIVRAIERKDYSARKYKTPSGVIIIEGEVAGTPFRFESRWRKIYDHYWNHKVLRSITSDMRGHYGGRRIEEGDKVVRLLWNLVPMEEDGR